MKGGDSQKHTGIMNRGTKKMPKNLIHHEDRSKSEERTEEGKKSNQLGKGNNIAEKLQRKKPVYSERYKNDKSGGTSGGGARASI